MIDADPFPAVAWTLVGASGAAAGVTGVDGADAELEPIEFLAVTVNEYEVPLERPVIIAVVNVVVVVMFPGLEVIV